MIKRNISKKEETKRLLDHFLSSSDSDDYENEDILLHKTWLTFTPEKDQENTEKNRFSIHSGTPQTSKTLKLKRQINLFSAVAIIIGSIIGSGIFISPKGVLQYSGSFPLSLLIWAFCGVISLFGALCYAELGALIPLSGGDYMYLRKAFEHLGAFGAAPSFLYMWISIFVFGPSSPAILALTIAEYAVEPLYPNCPSPNILKKLIAVLCVLTIAFINCASVRLTTNFNNIFSTAKLLALCIIIIGGIVRLLQGQQSIVLTSFEGSTSSVSDISTAIYFGMWSYSGWNSLNFLTEEIINPEKNILRAIFISIPLVTLCYVLTNIAYAAVMSYNELLSSEAVALLFANDVLGIAAPVIPLLVAASAFGSALIGCLNVARLSFVAGREGHLMNFLSYIHMRKLTPVPAVVFNTFLTVIYLCLGNFETLIKFLSFIEWLCYGLTMVALIYMRCTKKAKSYSYKVPLLLPIIVLIFSIFLVVTPIVQDPRVEYLYAILFILLGFVFYIIFICCKVQLKYFDKFSIFVQLLLNVAPTVQKTEEEFYEL